jgi:hypothetical protein
VDIAGLDPVTVTRRAQAAIEGIGVLQPDIASISSTSRDAGVTVTGAPVAINQIREALNRSQLVVSLPTGPNNAEQNFTATSSELPGYVLRTTVFACLCACV